ncbi:MAG: transglutaminase family protein [Pseudomonadota bacterium]|nr:transglutaminase family protein [Pseudomonadota bacterium]
MSYEKYLKPGKFIDSDHPVVLDFAEGHVGQAVSDQEKAVNFYYAIRDGIRYNPYMKVESKVAYTASDAVLTGEGWCVPKAALMTACLRINGIPARPGYADVKNHLASRRLIDLLGSEIFFWHSYCEAYLDGRWVKSTPSFNLSLCNKFGLKPLEFDGKSEALFHEFDQAGNKHMEYVHERGTYFDVPMNEIKETFKTFYRSEYILSSQGDLYAEVDSDKNAGS